MKPTEFRSVAQILDIFGLEYRREYKFHPNRHWRFDYALVDKRIAIEYEGIYGRGQSRHTNVKGYRNDCEKYNEAQILGWKVIRITNDMLKDGTCAKLVEKVKFS